MMFVGHTIFRLEYLKNGVRFFRAVVECDKYALWQNGLLHKFIRFSGGKSLKLNYRIPIRYSMLQQ